jgi:hypothetical protein
MTHPPYRQTIPPTEAEESERHERQLGHKDPNAKNLFGDFDKF